MFQQSHRQAQMVGVGCVAALDLGEDRPGKLPRRGDTDMAGGRGSPAARPAGGGEEGLCASGGINSSHAQSETNTTSMDARQRDVEGKGVTVSVGLEVSRRLTK